MSDIFHHVVFTQQISENGMVDISPHVLERWQLSHA
jgi:hypothetical protein